MQRLAEPRVRKIPGTVPIDIANRSTGCDTLSAHRVGRLGEPYWREGDGPTTIDLCAGAGGLSLGFRSVGFRVVVAVDKDPVAAAVFRNNAPDVAVIGPTTEQPDRGNIETLSGAELLAAGAVTPGTLGMLVGGMPCQGYSEIGLRRPTDPRNALYRHFIRLVGETRPVAYCFENVRGMLDMVDADGVNLFDDLLASLRGLGYSAKPALINAATHGVPQLRTRLFVVGARDGQQVGLREGLLGEADYITTRDAMGDLPEILTGTRRARGFALPYAAEPVSDYARLLRGDASVVSNCVPVRHGASVRRRFAALPVGGTEPATRHRRLRLDKPAWTLRAGNRRQTACRPVHPTRPRVITIREAARLASFPDEFFLPNHKAISRMLIGNSVPPLLAHYLALQIAAQVFGDSNSV